MKIPFQTIVTFSKKIHDNRVRKIFFNFILSNTAFWLLLSTPDCFLHSGVAVWLGLVYQQASSFKNNFSPTCRPSWRNWTQLTNRIWEIKTRKFRISGIGLIISLRLHLPALCCEACFVKFGFKEEAIELLIACYRSPLFKAVSDTVLSLHNKLKELSVLCYLIVLLPQSERVKASISALWYCNAKQKCDRKEQQHRGNS